MNEMIRKGKRRLAGFLLALFCSYTASVTCFAHSHVVNGERVTHSHPYRTVPDSAGHSHTAAQFISIALLSHFMALSAVFAAPACVFSGKFAILRFSHTFFVEPTRILSYALRAPPVPAGQGGALCVAVQSHIRM
ncbi:MAG: hypothetical protein LBP64_08955 [Tannerella sp.]|nr:hypothetical protein [Tannerella sp.]